MGRGVVPSLLLCSQPASAAPSTVLPPPNAHEGGGGARDGPVERRAQGRRTGLGEEARRWKRRNARGRIFLSVGEEKSGFLRAPLRLFAPNSDGRRAVGVMGYGDEWVGCGPRGWWEVGGRKERQGDATAAAAALDRLLARADRSVGFRLVALPYSPPRPIRASPSSPRIPKSRRYVSLAHHPPIGIAMIIRPFGTARRTPVRAESKSAPSPFLPLSLARRSLSRRAAPFAAR